ncbi:hypothetical protein CHARACLAT_012318 [Characodon lateralis]|uniref:Secreted protein n=1 Tax=Characodon lateralis TaxID=208331 RepID=A0ABU7DU46_9TELE|nr:hypothetical protein [Characodon lateralis]
MYQLSLTLTLLVQGFPLLTPGSYRRTPGPQDPSHLPARKIFWIISSTVGNLKAPYSALHCAICSPSNAQVKILLIFLASSSAATITLQSISLLKNPIQELTL